MFNDNIVWLLCLNVPAGHYQKNNLHLHSAFSSTCHIHPFTHWWQRLPYKVPTTHQEQFGVHFFPRGHFNMQLNLGFRPVTFWSPDNLLYPLSYSHPKQCIPNVPECLKIKFKNILKVFCDNLLKMFSVNIAWALCPNVLENSLSGKFSSSSQNVWG